MRRLATVAALVLLAACDLTGPNWERVDVQPMDVPENYAGWYAEVEDCLGQRGDFAAVRWFTATELSIDGVSKGGITRFPDEITMLVRRVTHPWSVKHEMIHHVTQVGDAVHDTDDMERCAVLVMP